jgi:hypothetical protein
MNKFHFLTRIFLSLGLTRDSMVWFWGKIVAISALIASGMLDLNYWLSYVGLHPTVYEIRWVQVISVIILYFSGQYSNSLLPGKLDTGKV